MKHKVSDIIDRIEGDYDVKSIQTERYGVRFEIYPWIKARLFHKYIMGSETLKKRSAMVLFSQIWSLFYGTWNIFIRKYDIWAFTNSVERMKLDNKYYDKVFDGIDKKKTKKILLIELRLFRKYNYFKVASRYVASRSVFLLFEEFFRLFIIRKIHIDNAEIIDQIQKELSCKIEVQSILKKQFAQYRMMRFWLSVLPKPKVVFLTVSYANYGYIRAFKERGIKVVEFQHGVINKNHQAYYYAVKPDPIQFPDSLCVFGQNEFSFLESSTHFPHSKKFIVGRSIMDAFLLKAIENKSIKKICVSLQEGPIGENLIEFLLEFSARYSGQFTFVLVPRRTSVAHYLENYNFSGDFVFSRDNIYATIAASDAHITAYSTTAVEALSIGKRSILIDIKGKATEVFGANLGQNPYAFFTNTIEELKEHLSNTEIVEKELIARSNDQNIKAAYSSNISFFLTEIWK